MSPVLIVNMPFSNLRWPNLGPSLLKAGLARQGIGCDIAYFNFDFAERVGLDDYYWIADDFAFVLGGERLFAKHYFGGLLPDDEGYFRQVLEEGRPADQRRRRPAVRGVGPARGRLPRSVPRTPSIGRGTRSWVSQPPSSRPCLRSVWPGGSRPGGRRR